MSRFDFIREMNRRSTAESRAKVRRMFNSIDKQHNAVARMKVAARGRFKTVSVETISDGLLYNS